VGEADWAVSAAGATTKEEEGVAISVALVEGGSGGGCSLPKQGRGLRRGRSRQI
jgi:hypothetical protein